MNYRNWNKKITLEPDFLLINLQAWYKFMAFRTKMMDFRFKRLFVRNKESMVWMKMCKHYGLRLAFKKTFLPYFQKDTIVYKESGMVTISRS